MRSRLLLIVALAPDPAMIIYKIWMIERGTRDAFSSGGSSGLRRAIRIIVESGLLYSLSVICNMGAYVAGNNALYGVSDCVSSRYDEAIHH